MKRTILLADDSSTIQRLVERTFEGSEFVVEAVSNGEAAIRKLEEVKPAAVLADIHMPGKNGYEVCAWVKKHPAFSPTPVVLLVGAFEVFDEPEARQAGADAWITKPFEPKNLAETVSQLVLSASTEQAVAAIVPDELEGTRASGTERVEHQREHSQDRAKEVAITVPASVDTARGDDAPEEAEIDILGLKELFPQPDPPVGRPALTEEEVDAIADRVIDRLSADVVESIAWDIVPEIADRVMRDELNKKE